MWTLLVVTMFYQRGPQPEVVMHDFQSQQACATAARFVMDSIKDGNKIIYESMKVFYSVQCVKGDIK